MTIGSATLFRFTPNGASTVIRLMRHRLRGPSAACLLLLLSAAGCAGLDKVPADGISDSENWGQELREPRAGNTRFGGVSTKANQIERNLGVR